MARKARDTKEPTYVTTLSLDASTKAVLAAIRYKNASEAARYLIRYAIQHGALAPYLNTDGSLKTPTAPRKPGTLPKGERVYVGKRLDPNDPTFAGWDDDSPTPPSNQAAAPAPIIWDEDEPDENDPSITWPDRPAVAAPAQVAPAQVAPAPAITGYKPATDAEMKATMQAWAQSLK